MSNLLRASWGTEGSTTRVLRFRNVYREFPYFPKSTCQRHELLSYRIAFQLLFQAVTDSYLSQTHPSGGAADWGFLQSSGRNDYSLQYHTRGQPCSAGLSCGRVKNLWSHSDKKGQVSKSHVKSWSQSMKWGIEKEIMTRYNGSQCVMMLPVILWARGGRSGFINLSISTPTCST